MVTVPDVADVPEGRRALVISGGNGAGERVRQVLAATPRGAAS